MTADEYVVSKLIETEGRLEEQGKRVDILTAQVDQLQRRLTTIINILNPQVENSRCPRILINSFDGFFYYDKDFEKLCEAFNIDYDAVAEMIAISEEE